jgi:photosystem II stability/assembly factor-like uncharacterized protein
VRDFAIQGGASAPKGISVNTTRLRLVIAAAAAIMLSATAADAAPNAATGLNWRLVGPFRGGWATVVEGVPSAPDTFFMGTAGGGVWRTQNAGRTWTSLFDHGGASSIGGLAVSPSNPKIIYVGTGQAETRYDLAGGYGVFKSTDGGVTWASLGFADTRHIGKIWVDPKNPNLVLLGAQGHFFGPNPQRGMFRSTDGGKTWSQVLKIDDWTGIDDIASDPKNPRLLFASAWEVHQYPWLSYFIPDAGAGSAVYKSTDEGAHWTKLTGGGWPAGALGRIGLAVAHTAKGTRVYATVDSESSGGLWRSDDAGAHWSRVNEEKAFAGSYASRLEVQPNDPDVVYTVGQSIRRCTKGGAACDFVKGAPGGDDYHHIWINPLHPDHVITGSDQGAVVSVDGWKTWSSWYNQPTGQFYHLATDNRFPYWIYSGQQDSGTVGIASRSDYGAVTNRDWHPVGGDERDYDVPDPADPDILYDSGLGGRVTKWDGHTGQITDIAPWPVSSYGKRPTLVRYHYLWATPLMASRSGPWSLYLGGQVLFRTQDRGNHWTTISGDLTGKVAGAKNCDDNLLARQQAKDCGYGSISAIAPQSESEIWVGTDDGLIQLTRDAGAHWSNITPRALALWAKVASLDVSSLQAGTAYAAIDGHRLDDFSPQILRTRDYGKTWTNIAGNLPRDQFVSVVRADPVKAGLLYAGTDLGAFVSPDDGAHWLPLGQKLPTAWVTDLLVQGDDLIAATEGRALWSLDNITPLRQSVQASETAHLFQPAHAIRVHANNTADTPLPPEEPQSANPPAGTAIDYWLAKQPSGPVVLEVHDASGALVRRFASSDKPARPDGDRYFDAGWIQPPQALAATAGFHRFMWNLRYPRPLAIRHEYTIAAVWGVDTPVLPEGPFVLPGTYQVVLKVDGRSYNAPLTVGEDPRVKTSQDDLKASLALSQQIDALLAKAREGYGERQAVEKQLDLLFPEKAKAVKDSLRDIADKLRKKPMPGETTFDSVDGMLGGIAVDLGAVDTAPTDAQRAVVADAAAKLDVLNRNWAALKSGPLATMNAGLARAHRKPVVIPAANTLVVEPPEEGDDVP